MPRRRGACGIGGEVMFRVVILRRDGASDVLREKVKHLLYRNGVMVLYLGEHGTDRWAEHWPMDVIDHVKVYEIERTH